MSVYQGSRISDEIAEYQKEVADIQRKMRSAKSEREYLELEEQLREPLSILRHLETLED